MQLYIVDRHMYAPGWIGMIQENRQNGSKNHKIDKYFHRIFIDNMTFHIWNRMEQNAFFANSVLDAMASQPSNLEDPSALIGIHLNLQNIFADLNSCLLGFVNFLPIFTMGHFFHCYFCKTSFCYLFGNFCFKFKALFSEVFLEGNMKISSKDAHPMPQFITDYCCHSYHFIIMIILILFYDFIISLCCFACVYHHNKILINHRILFRLRIVTKHKRLMYWVMKQFCMGRTTERRKQRSSLAYMK